jgi:hypothetical protein
MAHLINKKGISMVLTIAELVVILAVVVGTFTIARERGTSEGVKKMIIAQDFRAMVDALVALPGDGVVHYPAPVGEYTIVLTSQKISVLRKEHGVAEARSEWATIPFVLPAGYEADGIVEGSRDVYLKKEGTRITLTDAR